VDNMTFRHPGPFRIGFCRYRGYNSPRACPPCTSSGGDDESGWFFGLGHLYTPQYRPYSPGYPRATLQPSSALLKQQRIRYVLYVSFKADLKRLNSYARTVPTYPISIVVVRRLRHFKKMGRGSP
jgi:hypothetical protein